MTNINNFPIITKKISELSNATLPLSGAETLSAIQSLSNKKLTVQDIVDLARSIYGTAALLNSGIIEGTVPVIGTGDKISNTLLNESTEVLKGIIEIATDNETFSKNAANALTPEKLFNDVRNQEFIVSNEVGSLAHSVAAGASYNILTSLLEANENQWGNISIIYKDISNNPQDKILDETNNKFLFPSNLNTFNVDFIPYIIRITGTYDIASTSNVTTKFYLRLRRIVDNSIILTLDFARSDLAAENGVGFYGIMQTFVNSETDPFVLDGCYIDIANDSSSATSITLQSINIRIFRTC